MKPRAQQKISFAPIPKIPEPPKPIDIAPAPQIVPPVVRPSLEVEDNLEEEIMDDLMAEFIPSADDYDAPAATSQEASEEADVEEADDEGDGRTMEWVLNHIFKTKRFLLNKKKKGGEMKTLDMQVRYIDDLTMLQCFIRTVLGGEKRMKASMDVAKKFHSDYTKIKPVYLARRIRFRYEYYRIHLTLPVDSRGGRRDGTSLLDDERMFQACRTWLTEQDENNRTPENLAEFVNNDLLTRFGLVPKNGEKKLSSRAMQRWFDRLGYTTVPEKKGIYFDGHEREDVIDYRQEVFLPEFEKCHRLCIQYEEINGEWVTFVPEFHENEQRHVILYHDESCFHAKETATSYWMPKGSCRCPPKGKGKLIHRSDFISTEGKLRYQDADGNWIDAGKTIFPGAGGDRWWNSEQLEEQLEHAIDVFERMFPGCIAVFIFDQSSAHASKGKGALNAFGMNKRPGGKPMVQKDTYYPPETNGEFVFQRGRPQKLYTIEVDENGVEEKVAKGIKNILLERGININGPDGKEIRGKCAKPRCTDPLPGASVPRCCLARILWGHKDFQDQKSLLEEKLRARGHKCLFLPKFHCELNPIEMFWGYVKQKYRNIKKSCYEDAKKEAEKCLQDCPLETMRRYCNRATRFMDAYRKGLKAKAAQWCVRQQKGHRTISERIMRDFDNEFPEEHLLVQPVVVPVEA
jgi:hypothetical protein